MTIEEQIAYWRGVADYWEGVAARCRAAAALYGSAKRWALGGLAGWLAMLLAGIALGVGGPSWLDWVGRGAGCVIIGCCWRSHMFTVRARKLAESLP